MLAFPLSVDRFFARLPMMTQSLDCPTSVQVSQTQGGQFLTADLGPQLWQGQVRLAKLTEQERADAEVLLEVLRRAGRFFYAFDTRRPWPWRDRRGLILGTATPSILGLPSARELRLQGLPARYVLVRGDYLSFDYGAGLRAFHAVVDETVIASVAGETPAFEVSPPVRPGAAVAAPVTLVRPAFKAMIVPGSVSKSESWRTYAEGGQFDLQQVLS